MAVGRGSIMRAAKAGSKKEKSIEFMTQATESQVEEKGMAEEKQDVKETAVAPADDQGSKEAAAEAETLKKDSAAEAVQAVEKEVPVKKTAPSRRASASKKSVTEKTADKTTTKAAPGKKAGAKTKAPARAKKETKVLIKEVEETVAAEPVKSVSKNYVGIKDKMPTYLL